MSRIVIFLGLFILAAAMPNDGQESSHDEGVKHPKMPDTEIPKPQDPTKVSSGPKPLDNKGPPAVNGHGEQKN